MSSQNGYRHLHLRLRSPFPFCRHSYIQNETALNSSWMLACRQGLRKGPVGPFLFGEIALLLVLSVQIGFDQFASFAKNGFVVETGSILARLPDKVNYFGACMIQMG